jgi:ketosteroid isomerase-like protein
MKEVNMTEQENVQLVKQAYQNVASGDIPSLLNLFSENVQWRLPEMANVSFSGTWQGHEGIKQFFQRLAEVQDIVEFEPREFIAQDDKVVVLGVIVSLALIL